MKVEGGLKEGAPMSRILKRIYTVNVMTSPAGGKSRGLGTRDSLISICPPSSLGTSSISKDTIFSYSPILLQNNLKEGPALMDESVRFSCCPCSPV